MRYLKLFLLITLLFGCSEATKLQKAENRVLANVNSVNKVGLEYLKLHPCVNDSVVKWLPSDTITKLDVWTDSVEKVVKDTVYVVRTQIKEKTVTKTKEVTVKDLTENKRLNDSLAVGKQLEIDLKKESLSWQEKYNYAKHRGDTLLWLVIAIALVSGIVIFRKPIFSLFTKLPI